MLILKLPAVSPIKPENVTINPLANNTKSYTSASKNILIYLTNDKSHPLMNVKKLQFSISPLVLSLALFSCSSANMELSCSENARFYANSQKDKVFDQFKKDAEDFGTKAAVTCGVGGIIAGIPMPVITPIIGLGCVAVGKYATNYYRENHQEETEQKALEVYTNTLAEKLDGC